MMNRMNDVEWFSRLSLRPMVAAWLLGASAGYGTTTYYVWRDNPSPQTPFTNWTMAATCIQDAVDLTRNGDTVLVTNGTYDTGGAITPDYALTNRVCVTNAITLRSVDNDPARTIIQGAPAPGGGCGTGAVRCVYLSGDAAMIGFTVSNGFTWKRYDKPETAQNNDGAGILMNSSGAVVSNCLMRNNTTERYGGGVRVFAGTLRNSTLMNNKATYGGGAAVRSSYSMHHCTVVSNSGANGGGLYLQNSCLINNCMITDNTGSGGGAGVIVDSETATVTIRNCLLAGNRITAGTQGGGGIFLAGGKILNCTLSGNASTVKGGGLKLYKDGSATNCIIWGNTVSSGTDSNVYLQVAATTGVVAYTCTGPLLSGIGNKAKDPMFADPSRGNYRLRAHSPCIDAGNKQGWMASAVDLDGRKRIYGGQVDMGAYEKFCPGVIFSIR